MGVVLLVRHGQASFGAEDYDVLSETGHEQARVLGAALRSLSPAAVLHGGMRRQRDTAASLVAAAGWGVVPEVDRGWDEFDHVGVVTRGLAPGEEHRLHDRRAFQQLFDEATLRWAAGESDADYDEVWPSFHTRVRAALDRAVDRPGPVVVVSSGGPIAAVCAGLVDPAADAAGLGRLWGSFNTVTANASVTRVLQGSTGRRLLTFNEHSHLPRDLVTYR